VIKKEAETILKCKHLTYNTDSAHVECKIRSDTSNNRGNWYNLKITQTKPEQQTGRAQHQVTTANSHIVHCTQFAESDNVKVQNIFHGPNNNNNNNNNNNKLSYLEKLNFEINQICAWKYKHVHSIYIV